MPAATSLAAAIGAAAATDGEAPSFGVVQDAKPRQARTKPTRFISVSPNRGKMTLTAADGISNAAD